MIEIKDLQFCYQQGDFSLKYCPAKIGINYKFKRVLIPKIAIAFWLGLRAGLKIT